MMNQWVYPLVRPPFPPHGWVVQLLLMIQLRGRFHDCWFGDLWAIFGNKWYLAPMHSATWQMALFTAHALNSARKFLFEIWNPKLKILSLVPLFTGGDLAWRGDYLWAKWGRGYPNGYTHWWDKKKDKIFKKRQNYKKFKIFKKV